MSDDIGVFSASQEEAETHAARVSVGVGVGDVGDSGRVREADPDGGGGVVEVGCCGELGGFWGGCEGAAEDYAFGVCCEFAC